MSLYSAFPFSQERTTTKPMTFCGSHAVHDSNILLKYIRESDVKVLSHRLSDLHTKVYTFS